MTNKPVDIGRLLRFARIENGYSLRDVEKGTGISNAHVCHLEHGRIKEPSPHKLRALAKFYGISYGLLMSAAGYWTAKDRRSW